MGGTPQPVDRVERNVASPAKRSFLPCRNTVALREVSLSSSRLSCHLHEATLYHSGRCPLLGDGMSWSGFDGHLKKIIANRCAAAHPCQRRRILPFLCMTGRATDKSPPMDQRFLVRLRLIAAPPSCNQSGSL